jgi:hypothetical protein
LRSPAKRLRRFLRRPAAEQRLLFKAMLLLVATRLGLWLLPFQALRQILGRLAETSVRPSKREELSVEKTVWGVEAAGKLMPWASTCLTQALAAQVLLMRRRYSARLRIGVAKGDGDRLEAHAWIESEGKVVIGDQQLDRYTSLAVLDGLSGR